MERAPLPYVFSVPASGPAAASARPLLCFLHGYDEGEPTPLREGLMRHGPLSATAAARASEAFVVLAAQLPERGDLWLHYADGLREILARVEGDCGVDTARRYLTGFSYGANGVFDLALAQPNDWAALWAVDPTRVPPFDPGVPIWLSSGEVSRHYAGAFMERLALEPLQDAPRERIYLDRGADHVGTARLAYADGRIYHWLLEQRAPSARGRR